MESAHAVVLGEETIGSLLQRGDAVRFVFQDDYWSRPGRHVLGAWFEDNPLESPSASLRLPAWFANLLPEGRMREWIAGERATSSDRELQLLLHIGADLPGSVRVVEDAGDPAHLASLRVNPAPKKLTSIDRSIWRFSLAGVGMKFSMLRAGDRLTIPAKSEVGDWIVKLPDARHPMLVENEFGVMRLAREVGIDVPDIDIVDRGALPDLPEVVWPADESKAFAIRRFDREQGRRVHIEDFCQVRGWYPDQKYDGDFISAAAIAYRRKDEDSLAEFVRRLTFSFLVGNGDAHLKNWSLLYPDGRSAQLSPAYDLVSTGVYYEGGAPETTGLKFSGSNRFDLVGRSGFERMQRKLEVRDDLILDVVGETVKDFERALEAGADCDIPQFVRSWIRGHASRLGPRLGGS